MFVGNVEIADFAAHKRVKSKEQFAKASLRDCAFIGAFSAESSISTLRGLVEVKNLTQEDRVFTRDNGFQKVKFVGKRDIQENHKGSVRVLANSIAKSVPCKDVNLSHDQHVLLACAGADNFSDESLVVCSDLVKQGQFTIVEDVVTCEYVIELERDEILLVDGLWVSTSLRETKVSSPILSHNVIALAEVSEPETVLGARPISSFKE